MKYGGRVRHITTPCGVTCDGDAKKHPDGYGQYIAIWDTGAAITTISERVVKQLGLNAASSGVVNHVGGRSTYNTYFVDLLLPDGIAVQSLKVMDGVLNGCDVLVGMDIISMGNLAISNLNGETTLSFQIPADKVIDFTNRQKRGIWAKIKTSLIPHSH